MAIKGMLKDILAAVVIITVSWAIGTALMYIISCSMAHGGPATIGGRFTFFPDNPEWSRLKGTN